MELVEKHSPVQKVWWWVVTLFYLTLDIELAIERLQARQACVRGHCALTKVTDRKYE